jgi:hypothetical protein
VAAAEKDVNKRRRTWQPFTTTPAPPSPPAPPRQDAAAFADEAALAGGLRRLRRVRPRTRRYALCRA